MEKADVVILGSGYGGSIPAYKMAEDGRKVVVLERGRRLETKDFKQSDEPKHIESVLELVVASNNAALRVGSLMGGASINMDGGCFRAPSSIFLERDEQGRPYWPEQVTRQVLDPYYDEAEKMMKVRQMRWDEIPKGGGLFAEIFAKSGVRVDRARMNYTDCVHCGFCSVGCGFGKKQSLTLNYIPAAEEKGATFRPNCFVHHVEPKDTGFEVFYREGQEEKSIWGQLVFVAGGGIHTPAILHRSRQYLPKMSQRVGKDLNFNGESAYLMFLPEDYGGLDEYYCYMGMENSGMMCYDYLEKEKFTFHPGGGMEPTLFAAVVQANDDDFLPKRAWGLEFKRFVEKVYPHRVVGFSSLGLAPPTAEVTPTNNDSPAVSVALPPAYETYLDRMEKILESVAAKVNAKLVSTVPRNLHGTTSAHHLASCRMGADPETSAVSPDGHLWGYPNLFCVDASSLSFALGVNPALTISANALRVCDYVKQNR